MEGIQEKATLKASYKEAFRLADQAVKEDEKDNWIEAKRLYERAAESVMHVLHLETDDRKLNVLLQKRQEYLDRAAELALLNHQDDVESEDTASATAQGMRREQNTPPDSSSPSSHHSSTLSASEVQVLKQSSYINGKIYLPWSERDGKEALMCRGIYTDDDGRLALSPQQRLQFSQWMRAGDILGTVMMLPEHSTSIVQDVVTDCSVVASLSVSAAYERNFAKQLVTSCIFPQNAAAVPTYNPDGKYVVKLILNGVARQVVVDDFLPVDKKSNPLCAFSEDGSLWPSILEKAYLKVWGGYGFPGSNSGIDLHAMTGWIPENIFFKDPKLNQAHCFRRLQNGLHAGNALITLGTPSVLDDSVAQLGLVGGHAYSVLDACEVVGLGRKLVPTVIVRNPWRQAGTPNAQLVSNAQMTRSHSQLLKGKSNGVFSVPFADVCQNFETAHVNWDPRMWTHRYTLHASWPPLGPTKDVFNLGNNPQYSLEVDVDHERLAAVWILLTKHVTMTEENTDYITLHVYSGTNGEKVYYPDTPFVRGVYINNPHILIKFSSPVGCNKYTIVLSQHEKSVRALQYTFTVYAMSPFHVQKVPELCPHIQQNPQYIMDMSEPGSIVVLLEAPKQFAVNVKLLGGSDDTVMHSSGDYRKGFCYLKCDVLEAGRYTIVPSTYAPNCIGSFLLSVQSSGAARTYIDTSRGSG
ncbi:hypothetical protein DFJ77DRAFT_520421 [Powellomyces hirtus]|nr:hypothetical protein DFJ77DRAFT_520421 [Powellomyces hirtus]